jgi:hypothetical protein
MLVLRRLIETPAHQFFKLLPVDQSLKAAMFSGINRGGVKAVMAPVLLLLTALAVQSISC